MNIEQQTQSAVFHAEVLAALKSAVAAQLVAWDMQAALASIVYPDGFENAQLNKIVDDVGIFASGTDSVDDIGAESFTYFMENYTK